VSAVTVTREGPVATLTLDRPERRNALSPELMGELAARVGDLDADPDVRVLVLAGAGPSFSAGADLEWMRASRELSAARNLEDAAAMQRAFETLDACGTAVVARVHGHAMGGGAGLVACADLAVVTGDARFAFSEVRLGLIPAVVSPYVLRAIGPRAARSLFTSGRTFDAEEALRLGLVHRVVDGRELDEAVAEAVDSFLAAGPQAVAAAKALVREAAAAFMLPDLPRRIAEIRVSPEGQEGIAAFLDERRSRWTSGDS
jgi:methylglutaconyl-CoA hydratase